MLLRSDWIARLVGRRGWSNRLRRHDGGRSHHSRHLREVVRTVAQPPPREPDRQRVHRAPAKRAAVLDVFADGGQRASQTALHGGLGEADLKGYLTVGEAAEVRKLDHLLVL